LVVVVVGWAVVVGGLAVVVGGLVVVVGDWVVVVGGLVVVGGRVLVVVGGVAVLVALTLVGLVLLVWVWQLLAAGSVARLADPGVVTGIFKSPPSGFSPGKSRSGV
jgi:hypothetical protein